PPSPCSGAPDSALPPRRTRPQEYQWQSRSPASSAIPRRGSISWLSSSAETTRGQGMRVVFGTSVLVLCGGAAAPLCLERLSGCCHPNRGGATVRLDALPRVFQNRPVPTKDPDLLFDHVLHKNRFS